MQRFSRRNALGWLVGVAVLASGIASRLINDMKIAVVIPIVGAVVITAYAILRLVEQTRLDAHLREFARTHGFSFSASGGISVSGLSGFPFGLGIARAVEDVVEGSYGGRACASYTYKFEQRIAGDRLVEQIFTVTQASLDSPLPRLDLVPEDIGTRILNSVGLSDIDLESAEFNRKWRVLCADKRYAVDVVDPRMMQTLLANRLHGVAVRIDGGRVFAWSAGVANVKYLPRRLDLVVGVANGIPAHVARRFSEAEMQRRAVQEDIERNAPTWATTGGVLNSGRYTGIGVDADGDGVDDYTERNR